MMLALYLLPACTLLAPPEISVTGVTPDWGYLGETTEVQIAGARFFPTLVVDAAVDDGGRVQGNFEAWIETDPPTPLESVQLVDYDQLSAEIPAGLAAGRYGLRVRAPSGNEATLADAFSVTETRADHLAISVSAAGWTVGDYVPVFLRLADPEGDPVPQAMAIELVATSAENASGISFAEEGLNGQVAVEQGVGVRGELGPDGEGVVLVTSALPDDVTFTATPVDDAVVDADSILLSWNPGSIADVDIDLPRTEFRVEAGETFSATVTLRDAMGNRLDTETARVVLLDECDDWWTTATVNGSATVEVTLTKACGADHLRAITTEGQWSSEGFAVLPGEVTEYTLVPTPDQVTAGDASLLLLVEGVDAYDNVVTDLDTEVTLRDDQGGLDPERGLGTQACPGFPADAPSRQVCTVALWKAAEAVVVTVSDPLGRVGVADPIEVTAADAAVALLSATATQVVAGDAFEVLVRLTDGWGNDVVFDPAGPDAPLFEDDTGTLVCEWTAEASGGQAYLCTIETATSGTELRVSTGGLEGVLADPVAVVNAALAEVVVEPQGGGIYTAGAPFDVLVRGYDAFGNLYLVQSDPTLDLADTTGTLEPDTGALGVTGEATVGLTITAAATGIRITASQTGANLGTSDPFVVTAGGLSALAVSAPAWIPLGEPTEIGITAVDAWGNAVADYVGPITVTTSGGSCTADPVETFHEGEGTATLLCTTAALSELVEAEDADGISGTSGWIDALDFGCAAGPTAELLLDGGASVQACISSGTAEVDVDASSSTAGDNGIVLVHFMDSDGNAERTTAMSTTLSWVGAGIRVVEAVVADRLACASAADGLAYIGDDDGDATGPITVTPASTEVATGGTVAVALSAVDCKGDVADLATLRVRADLGKIAGTSSGEGLEVALDASGQATVDWTFDRGFAETATFHAASADGGSYGAAEVTTSQDSERPHVLAVSPSGRISATVDQISVNFDEAIYSSNLNSSTVSLSGPTAVSISLSLSTDGRTLTVTPASPLAGSAGIWSLALSSNVRDRAGNRLDGEWTGAAAGLTAQFGNVADDALGMSGCVPDTDAFSPDGDVGVGPEVDEVTLTPTASGPATWWVWTVTDADGDDVRAAWALGTDVTFAWDGRGDDGRVLPEGYYTLATEAMDGQGNLSAPCEADITLIHAVEEP